MTSNEIVVAVVEALEACEVPYLLAGGYSCNAYGVPRSTKDADFVVELAPGRIQELASKLGDQFRLDPQLSFETVTATSRVVFHTAEHLFEVELFFVSDDPHDRERFARRCLQPFLGRDLYFPTAEDVVIMKLRWSRQARRSKDLDDVRNVVAVQRERLDWAYVHRWCEKHGTRKLLDEIRESIPEID